MNNKSFNCTACGSKCVLIAVNTDEYPAEFPEDLCPMNGDPADWKDSENQIVPVALEIARLFEGLKKLKVYSFTHFLNGEICFQMQEEEFLSAFDTYVISEHDDELERLSFTIEGVEIFTLREKKEDNDE